MWWNYKLFTIWHGQIKKNIDAHNCRYLSIYQSIFIKHLKAIKNIIQGIMLLGVVFDMAVVYYAKDVNIFDEEDKSEKELR